MARSANVPVNNLEPSPIKPSNTYLPVKGGQHIFEGSIVVLTGGFAAVASTALGLIVCGVATEEKDNTGGGDGAVSVSVRAGVFWMGNSSAGDAITSADRFSICYLVDDGTVAKTDGTSTRSGAGIVYDVDSVKGVAVLMQPPDGVGESTPSALKEAQAALGNPITVPVVLARHTNGSIAARLTPGFAGKIRKISAYVTDPVTTGAKLATFTPAINGTPVTGGALALTSGNCTPVGAKVDGSAITGLNAFDSNDEITLVASSVTAFAEGQVAALLFLDAAA